MLRHLATSITSLDSPLHDARKISHPAGYLASLCSALHTRYGLTALAVNDEPGPVALLLHFASACSCATPCVYKAQRCFACRSSCKLTRCSSWRVERTAVKQSHLARLRVDYVLPQLPQAEMLIGRPGRSCIGLRLPACTFMCSRCNNTQSAGSRPQLVS